MVAVPGLSIMTQFELSERQSHVVSFELPSAATIFLEGVSLRMFFPGKPGGLENATTGLRNQGSSALSALRSPPPDAR